MSLPAIETERRLLEPANGQEDALSALLSDGEKLLIRVSSDLDRDARFSALQWVLVTDRRVLVHRGEAPAEEVALDLVVRAHTETLVGGGRLVVERKGQPPIEVPYSGTQGVKFSEVALGIEELRKGDTFLIRTQLERTRCEKCNRLLPEKDGICPACIRRLATLGRIASFVLPYKGKAALLAAGSVVMTVAELFPPMITRSIVDDVLVPAAGTDSPMDLRIGLLGWLVVALIGLRVTTWLAEWIRGWTAAWLGARVTTDIRSQLYRRMEMLSLQFYDKRQVGAVMSRVTSDSGRLQGFLIDGLPYLIINALMLVGILGFLFWMSWRLTLYILVPVSFIIVLGWFFWERLRRNFGKYWQGWSDIIARVNETLSGIRVVKSFAREQSEIDRFEKRNRSLVKVGVKADLTVGIFFGLMSFLTSFGMLIVWLFGGMAVVEGEMTLGTLLAFYNYMFLLYGPLQWFGEMNSWMTRAFAGAERVFEVIDTPPEAYEDPDAIAMPDIQGRVTFRDVTFGYDKSKPVLKEIDLDIKPGEMIGLVGRSGVGKTTTVNLICRFYDVDRGGIEVDGVDIRKIRLQDVRSQIGIVLQDPFLFSGTISDNIRYGKPDATFEEIVKAAQAANAHDFVVTKPDGYDTQVGERGRSLSGGERQRVSIARAILHDPKILILDEATSSVDVQTEQKIQEAIGRLVKNRTTFAIAHRLSTLRNADRLVVLQDGKVAEVGTHQELMERQGIFYKLVELQRETSEIMAIKE